MTPDTPDRGAPFLRWWLALAMAVALTAAAAPALAEDGPKPAPQSGHAYSECRDGFWWLVSYHQVSDGKGGYTLEKTYDEKTSQPCDPKKKPGPAVPKGLDPGEIGPPPSGECLTAEDVVRLEAIRKALATAEGKFWEVFNQLKVEMRVLDEARNDTEGHIADRQEKIAGAEYRIGRLKEQLRVLNAQLRYLMARLEAASKKPPCPGLISSPPEWPTGGWPEEWPTDIDLPEAPPGPCYTNADNQYEEKLRDLRADLIKRRDALYDQLRPIVVQEAGLQSAAAEKQAEVNAFGEKKQPLSVPDAEAKAQAQSEAEALWAAVRLNLDEQRTLMMKIQAIDAAIAEIDARLKLPPKPPCQTGMVVPPPCDPQKPPEEHVSLPSNQSVVSEHVLAGIGVAAPAPGCPNRRAEDDEDAPQETTPSKPAD
jgi:hypothetical protein